MAEHDTRIRWTGRERDIVVSEYQALCAASANLPMLELLAAAQKTLPRERQRPPSYALRAWFNKELKAKVETQARRDPRQAAAVPGSNAGAAATASSSGGDGQGAAARWASAQTLEQMLPGAIRSVLRSPLSAEEMKLLIDTGVEVAVGVLGHPRVRQVVRSLMQGRDEEPFLAPRSAFEATTPAALRMKLPTSEAPPPPVAPVPRSGKMRVLIAGPAGGQLSEVSAPYEEHLELESWSPDQGFEQLRVLVDTADVVIGMPSLLTQAVQNTLRHYSKRYVRHTAGIAGLSGELGKLVPQEAK